MALKITNLLKNFRNLDKLKFREISQFFPIDEHVFGLTTEQIQLRESIFNFAQKELAPRAAVIDEHNNFEELRPFWRKLGELGTLGIAVNPEYGGTGGSYLDQTVIMEELSRACAAIGWRYVAHSSLVVNQIHRNGNEKQKQKYLPKLCSGEHIGAIAASEVGAGANVGAMKTRAEGKGDYYILNGSKLWVTNGPDADVLIVYAVTNPNAPNNEDGFSAFIVEKDTPGLTAGPKLDTLGMRGSNTSEIIFENCKIPRENLLGVENMGSQIMTSALDLERLVLASGPVGIMQACCDIAFSYANTRKQFEVKIGKFQFIQGKMADMYTTLSACRSYLYSVARACDNKKVSYRDCAGILLYTSEKVTPMALDALQILGGNGYINEYSTGRLLRDSKLFEIGSGAGAATSEIRKIVIGRSLNSEYNP